MISKKFKIYIAADLRLLENAFVKLPHPWHDLIISPHIKEPPKICPPSAMKSFFNMFMLTKFVNLLNLGKKKLCDGISQ